MRSIKVFFLFAFLLFQLQSNCQVKFGKYVTGTITDKNDSTFNGLLSLNYHSLLPAVMPLIFYNDFYSFIRYKQSIDSIVTKLSVSDIRFFTMEKDTFIVLNDFWITNNVHFENDFVKIVQRGEINLFEHYSTDPIETSVAQSVGFTAINYLGTTVIDDPTKTYIVEKDQRNTRVSERNFKKVIPIIIKDNQELVNEVKNKKYRFEDLPEIIRIYNQTKEPDEFNYWINQRRNNSKPSKLLVFRTKKRQSKDSIVFQIGARLFRIHTNNLDSTSVNISDDFMLTICPRDSECIQLEVPTHEKKIYLEVSQKESKPITFEIVDSEVGEFYRKRITYIIEKSSNNR